jgi:hypothetical protein
LATRFNVQKTVVRSFIKLDKEVSQYGKVRRGGDLMTGRHLVKESEDSRDASFVRVGCCLLLCVQFLITLLQYTLYVDRHARHRGITPDFEEKTFFGQLLRILVLELQAARQLDLAKPTTIILALIQEVKATLRDGIYTYKEFGAEEVVDLKTVQCVVGRVKDRGMWSIVDRSDNVVAQVD